MKSKKKREEGRERGGELGALTPALSHQTPLYGRGRKRRIREERPPPSAARTPPPEARGRR